MSAPARREIAIIGMSCVFPGARNLQRYWENILHKVDAVSDPPPDWEAELFYDPEAAANDRTYCRRGGWLGQLAEFAPLEYGVMPNSVDGAEPDHFLALRAATEALADAGYNDPGRLKPLRERTAVIIGRGTYVNRGNTTVVQHAMVVDSILRVLRQLHPEHGEEGLARIKRELKASLPSFHADTAPGLVPNIITGRIANRLDLMGPNYIVDAACASSLVAVDLAIADLLGGRCDMALAGGVHASTPPPILVIFSQLNALSRKGHIRPFDRDADGTLLGEGVGMVALKRLDDAERDGDRIYAVIKGVGTASDGRALGLLAPRLEGEELALRRAYEAAGVDPATVELIEAHGTATAVGDAVEVEALRRVLGPRRGEMPACALGSVKSMISHTMPASGSAGLIKAALALHHKVLPPTLHCENPNPKLQLQTGNFYLNTETRPWIHGSRQEPRRAGVNAFGFGGINAHVVLEEYTGPHGAPPLQYDWDSELCVVTGETRTDLLAEAGRLQQFLAAAPEDLALRNLAWTLNCTRELKPVRLAVVASSREDLSAKLGRAIARLSEERTKRIREVEGIYFFSQPLGAAGKLAFVFPGEGAQYPNMLADLAMHFPEVREVFDQMDRAFADHPRGYLPSQTIFPPPGFAAGRLWSMDSGAESVFIANQALWALMQKLEIRPHCMVGHSTGEHSALLCSGTVLAEDEAELFRHVRGVNAVFEEMRASTEIPEGVLLAVAGARHVLLESLVEQSGGSVFIALDNCPHQVVMCGTEAGVEWMMQKLVGEAAICQKLPFSRAYHTPWFEVFSQPLRRYFDTARIGRPQVPLYSCITTGLYPEDDPDQVRDLTSIQWARAVRFRETIETMYRDGARLFVEVGPRGNLTGFIDDTLRGKAYAAIPSNTQHRSGIQQLNHLAAQLVAHGVLLRLEHLYERRAPESVFSRAPGRKPTVLTLSGGLQPVRLPETFQLPAAGAAAGSAAPPVEPPAEPPPASTGPTVMEQHLQTMSQFLQVQTQVMNAYLGRRGGAPAAAPARPALPFVTEVQELIPGVRATARHRFSLDREPLFRDHTLGRNLSAEDTALSGLPVVPLTVTMEVLAEAGSLLEPGKVLTGMRDFRGYRWITLEQPEVAIELTAERREPGAVYVTMRESGSADSRRPLWAEGLMLFGDAYPQASPGPHPLERARPSRWNPELLYRDGMFHGPSFQAVRRIERSAANGNVAALEIPPRQGWPAGAPQPAWLTDAILLDAAGQAVAFWSQEELDPHGDIFPYRLGALHCCAPPQPPGTRVECRVLASHFNDKEIRSDIELVDQQGRLLYRLEGWEDRRFPQPPRFWRLRIAPGETYLSRPWNEPVAAFLERGMLACCRLEGFPADFFQTSHEIWLKVLAHLVLGRREREHWQAMQAVSKRRQEWLLGRCAAKDAVRMLLEERFQARLSPADIEILPDAHGRPTVRGAWTSRLGVTPVVSISHSRGTAVAVAAMDGRHLVGIDIESLTPPPDGFQMVAFSEEEQRMLAALEGDLRHEWSLRLWCAKEAVAKAFGRGLTPGLQAFRVTEAEVTTGIVQLELPGGLLSDFPQLHGQPVIAYTARERDLVFSTMIYQQGTVQ